MKSKTKPFSERDKAQVAAEGALNIAKTLKSLGVTLLSYCIYYLFNGSGTIAKLGATSVPATLLSATDFRI